MSLLASRPDRARGFRALSVRVSALVEAARANGRLDVLSRALWLALIPGGLLFLAMQVYFYWQAGNIGLDSHAYWLAAREPHTWYTLPPAYRDAFLYSPAFAQLIAPFTLQCATVKDACADKLKGVLDTARGCPVHVVDRAHAAELCDLLDLHRQRTQVPGLIHITLASEGEPLAGTPRAAIRAMFSSAIDVLVMGRFLLMKDYWLLRSES